MKHDRVTSGHNAATNAMEARCTDCGQLAAFLADEVAVPDRGKAWLVMELAGSRNHQAQQEWKPEQGL